MSHPFLAAEDQLIANALKIRFYPIAVQSAKGTRITDQDGKSYLDLTAGWAVAGIGYGHPRISSKIKISYERLSFTSQLSAPEPTMLSLAQELVNMTPGSFPKKVWFGHSGSDANDCVAKLVPLAKKRARMISFMGSYHGQTMGSLSLSGHPAQTRFIGSGNVVKIPYPNPYRPPFGETPRLTEQILQYVEQEVFRTICPPEDTAGIIVEGIQSDGGLIVPPDDFLPGLQELCRRYDMELIFDEVKVGLGRTGKWFSFDHENLVPDVVVLGKSLGAGLPISAVVAKQEILDVGTGIHMFTASGNPVSCSAALENIRIIQEEGLIERARVNGEYFLKRLKELQAKVEWIGDVRGRGLAIGVELVEDRVTKAPAAEKTAAVCYRCFELGLLVFYVGIHSNVIEITPPLVISREEIDLAVEVLDQAFSDLAEKKINMDAVRQYAGW
ncbi:MULTISPECIES: aspartate aminotransferase family protein [Brevibacillus]|uniref:4-aminobutyrate aminotransferase n=1 Tax=Brevibacillus fulvus TaxID=1125967 RepID=A0A939BTI2_9BACL|nr:MULTISPECIES: aspartate aminotransferase family protein [Brevibacillus]EJL45584.1 4-aminobutyrate aminotransferase family protein [Brevibacillus sp. CF112]MBM7591857.1 4-aminobutyrate aminotransferase [Brevibacillus fulvus]